MAAQSTRSAATRGPGAPVSAVELAAAFEHAPVGMAIADGSVTLVHANAAMGRLLGHAPERLVGRTLADLTHPDDLAASLAAVRRLADGEIGAFTLDKRYRHATGRVVWARVSVTLLPHEVPRRYVVHAADVTHERSAAAMLRETQERFREMTESIEQDFWLMDVEPLRLLYASPAAERIWGFDPMVNRDRPDRIFERLHPDDVGAFIGLFDGSLREAREREYRIVRGDGAVRWLRTRVFPARNADGDPDRLAGMTEDITTRKTAEQELERHRAFERLVMKLSAEFVNLPADRVQQGFDTALGELGALFGADRAAIFMLDDATGVAHATYSWSAGGAGDAPAPVTAFPFGADNPLRAALVRDGLLVIDAVGALADELGDTRARLLANGVGALIDVPIVRRGRLIGIFGCAAIRRSGAWAPDVADRMKIAAELFANALERVQVETALRSHREALAQALQVGTMGQLAAGIAHELNQPLGSILNYAQGLERRLAAGGADAAELREAVHKIAEQAGRAGDIVATFRGLARKGRANRTWHDANDLVRTALRFISPDVAQAGIRIRTQHARGLPRVQVDPIQIEQVVLNLVRNAVDALSGQPRALPGEIRLSTRRGEGRTVEVSVADNGPGVEPHHAPWVFDEFYTTKADGLGLGLSISRSIIEAHGGRLWLDTSAPRGATFRFTLSAAS